MRHPVHTHLLSHYHLQTLIYLTLSMTIFIVLDSTIVLEINDGWVSLMEALLITVYVAYFGSRGAEKITNLKR